MSKPIECTTPTVKPKVNCGLRAIMMCQCRFILGKKCTILVSNVDTGEGLTCVGARSTWENSAPLSQFCYKHKTILKNTVLKIIDGITFYKARA